MTLVATNCDEKLCSTPSEPGPVPFLPQVRQAHTFSWLKTSTGDWTLQSSGLFEFFVTKCLETDDSSQSFHCKRKCILAAVRRRAQAGILTGGLEIDRVGRLGVWLDRKHIRLLRRRVDDQLAESVIESQSKLGLFLGSTNRAMPRRS